MKKIIKKIVFIGVIAAGIVLVCTIGINIFVCVSASSDIVTDENDLNKGVDAIIVPGAGLTADNKPSLFLQDRLDTAIELYKAGISNRLLMSGDHGDAYHNEVLAMKEYAIEKGVPADDIFMDHAGFTTYETMIRARDVFEVNTAVIVTQKYHLYRALYIAKNLDLDVSGYPSEIKIGTKYLPFELREILARVKAFIYMIITPEPTYGGEKLPISGSGSVTDDN